MADWVNYLLMIIFLPIFADMEYIRIKVSFFIYACTEWFLVPTLEAVKDTASEIK